MKVENMYKLYEALKKLNVNARIEWSDIVRFSDAEANRLTEALHEKNPNVYTLYCFYLYVHDEDERFSELSFHHLGIQDVVSVIAEEILNASTEQMATNIYNQFDGIPESFKTKEEFLTYLRSMPKTREVNCDYADELKKILSHYDGGRIGIIQRMAKYYSKAYPTTLSSRFPAIFETLSATSMQTLLTLLYRYDANSSVELMIKFGKMQEESNTYDDIIRDVETFLWDFPVAVSNLPKLFLNDDIDQYRDIFATFDSILKQKCFHMVNHYADSEVQTIDDKKLLRKKIREVLNSKKQKTIDAFDYLLSMKYFEGFLNSELSWEEKNEKINFVTGRLLQEETADVFAKLLLRLPLDACRMIPAYVEKEKLDIMYENLWLYNDRDIFDKDREESYDLFQKLSSLSVDSNQKFGELLEFISFLNDPNRDEVLKILLSKENEPSFDYIFNQYKKQEEKRMQREEEKKNYKFQVDDNSFQIELVTVIELLDLGYDIDAVLDGFESGEDVTSKTLVRSMKYKTGLGENV